MTYVAATVQIAVGLDVEENREKCAHWVGEAKKAGASLVVLPEMSHRAPTFASSAQAYEHAVTGDHPFLAGVREAARRNRIWVAVNTYERAAPPQVLGTTFLIDDGGEVRGRYHKHLPFIAERTWMTPGRDAHPVFDTPLGRLGMYVCMDGLIPEPPRCLALQGAEVLINCLNSGGPDEAALHIPVRALENGVWVIAANKVGPMPGGHARGYAGGSMIVRPDGEVAARCDDATEMMACAEIDTSLVDRSRTEHRHPAVYRALYRPPASSVHVSAPEARPGAQLVVGCRAAVPGVWSVVETGGAVQVHDPSARLQATYRTVHPGPGDRLVAVETPYGTLGLSAGDDLWYMEAARCLALEGIDLLVHLGDWHPSLVVERAAENRIVVLAVGGGRCGLARLGPMMTEPHWRGRLPDLEVAPVFDGLIDLSLSRIKGDQISGRVAEACGVLVEPAGAPAPRLQSRN